MSTPQNLAIDRDHKGVVVWTFTRAGKQHYVKAAACVTKTFKAKPDTKEWFDEANAWGLAAAQTICDRMDYQESPAGQKEAAQRDYDQLKTDIDRKTAEREALKTKFPDLADAAVVPRAK